MKRSVFASFKVLAVAFSVLAAGVSFTACTSTGDGADQAAAVEGEASNSENAEGLANGNIAAENGGSENNGANVASAENGAAPNGASEDPFAASLNTANQSPAQNGTPQPNGELQALVADSANAAAPAGSLNAGPAASAETDPFAPVAPPQPETQNVAATNAATTATASAPGGESDESTDSTDSVVSAGDGVLPEMGSTLAYYIKRGDTLSGIAQRIFGDKNQWRSLADENSIQNPSLIYAGDILFYKLTAKSKNFAEQYEAGQKKIVTVQKGDTLSSIATKVLGSAGEWRTLWKMNASVSDPNMIRPGMVLTYRGAGESVALDNVANDDEDELVALNQ